MAEEREEYLIGLCAGIEFNYADKKIIADITMTMREVYVATQYDRRTVENSRRYNNPISGRLDLYGYAMYELGEGWTVSYSKKEGN